MLKPMADYQPRLACDVRRLLWAENHKDGKFAPPLWVAPLIFDLSTRDLFKSTQLGAKPVYPNLELLRPNRLRLTDLLLALSLSLRCFAKKLLQKGVLVKVCSRRARDLSNSAIDLTRVAVNLEKGSRPI